MNAAKVTNGGRAMLVIRNFGYLGIHSAISKKSKLARERLVDFTGEVQVRRRTKMDSCNHEDDCGGRVNVAKKWHGEFVSEVAVNGGRNNADSTGPSLYVQEVAPITLHIPQFNPRNPKHLKMKSHFHTSISNELILHPLNIENCPKRNIALKLEIARIVYRDELNALVAIPVKSCIHNSRRGPHLVQESYTACAYHRIDPYFLEEMKIKLPLTKLKSAEHGDLVALFTVYHVSVRGKKTWASKSNLNIGNGSLSSMEQIACGVLRISAGERNGCLLGDGLHPVHLKYRTKQLRGKGLSARNSTLPKGSKILEILPALQDSGKSLASSLDAVGTEGKSCSIDEFLQNNAADFNLSPQNIGGCEELQSTQTSTSSLADIEKTDAVMGKIRKVEKDQRMKTQSSAGMRLNLRSISLSSIHTQNETLENFLSEMPKPPKRLDDDEFCGTWKMDKNGIKKEMDHIRDTFEQSEMPSNRQLLQNSIDISTNSICPQSQIVAHFVRISFQLWRIVVAGNGEPSLAFANPAMPLPLRLHSFSTLLYVLNQVSSCMAKCNMSETSGSRRWSLNTMSSLVSFLFDEESIFLDPTGSPSEECSNLCECKHNISKDKILVPSDGTEVGERHTTSLNTLLDKSIHDSSLSSIVKSSSPRAKDSKEVSAVQAPLEPVEVSTKTPLLDGLRIDPPNNPSLKTLDIDFVPADQDSPEVSPNISPTSTQDDILLHGSKGKPAPLRTRSFSAPNEKQLKVDTKSDFQFALSAGISPNGNTSPFGAGPGFGISAGPAASRRKWLAGSVSLSTISEDNDVIDSTVVKPRPAEKEVAPINAIDTEIVLHSAKPSKVKQMRVPKVQQHTTSKEEIQVKMIDAMEELNSNDSDSQSSMTIPNMDEIESAGTAFLDSINATYGFG